MTSSAEPGPVIEWPTAAPFTAWLLPTALFALLWGILSGGDWNSWIIGAPAVLLAAAASIALHWPRGWSLSVVGLARFVPYFLWRSLYGSIDVASRALHPAMPIDPALLHYRIRLPLDTLAKILFVDTISLIPGTLSAELRERELTVHVLDSGHDVPRELQTLEEMVAGIFSIELPASGEEE